jgi:hypothetical protein
VGAEVIKFQISDCIENGSIDWRFNPVNFAREFNHPTMIKTKIFFKA